nr:hypothetical protein GCM10017745_17420 [Saccharothrix mutabilis subsp. capreolus]
MRGPSTYASSDREQNTSEVAGSGPNACVSTFPKRSTAMSDTHVLMSTPKTNPTTNLRMPTDVSAPPRGAP